MGLLGELLADFLTHGASSIGDARSDEGPLPRDVARKRMRQAVIIIVLASATIAFVLLTTR